MDPVSSFLWWTLGLSLALIAYHYAVYPLAVALAAALVARPRRPSDRRPTVTLVIAAYNEESVIAEKIENSLALDYPGLEVIVAADGSDDRTVAIAAAYLARGVVVLHQPRRCGKAAALNRALEAARGEVVVFSDANAMYRRDAIDALVAAFDGDRVAAVSGAKTVRPRQGSAGTDAGFGRSEGLYWRYENLIRASESRLGATVAAVGEMFAVRRSAARPIPPWVVNDDAWMTLDLLSRGYDVRFAPDARSEEPASLRESDEGARRRRIAAGRWGLLSHLRLWPVRRPFVLLALVSHKALRLVMPITFAAALGSNALLVATGAGGSLAVLILVAQAAFYAASLLGRTAGLRAGPGWAILRLCHFLVQSNLSLAAGFLDWLRGRSFVAWTRAPR